MTPDRTNLPYTKDSEQSVLNKSLDSKYNVLAVELLTENEAGTALDRVKTSAFSNNLATRIDNTAGTTIYIGKAPIGTATGASSWQIAKLDTSSGLIKLWADGDSLFNNVWDNRASLSYS